MSEPLSPIWYEVTIAPSATGAALDTQISDDVVIDPASARELDFFLTHISPAAGEYLTRPITVWSGPRRLVYDVRLSQSAEGGWRFDLGSERAAVDAPDRPVVVDPRLDDLNVMVWVTDRERLARWFNTAWLDFVGKSITDQLGWGWMSSMNADDLIGLMESYEAAHREQRGFEHVARVMAHDGQEWWTRVRAVPRLTDRHFDGFIGMCDPIEIARAENAPHAWHVADALPGADAAGDESITAVHRLANLGAVLEIDRPAEVVEAAFMRRIAARWLSQHDSLRDRHDEIVLAIGEAAANAAVHAYDGRRGNVRLQCEIGPAHAEFRVRDWGSWEPPTQAEEHRGVAIMQALADDFELRHLDDGTEIVLRFRLAAPSRD
jgi:anti-sigma regulatory factor (Ser/Thr protein kinase)/PAS domain-containing protein